MQWWKNSRSFFDTFRKVAKYHGGDQFVDAFLTGC